MRKHNPKLEDDILRNPTAHLPLFNQVKPLGSEIPSTIDDGSETRNESFRNLNQSASKTQRDCVYEAIRQEGICSDERIQAITGFRLASCIARRNELVQLGEVEKHPDKLTSKITGAKVAGWKVKGK